LFISGASFNLGDIDIGTVRIINTRNAVWQFNSYFRLEERFPSVWLFLPIVESQFKANAVFGDGGVSMGKGHKSEADC
jgi:hypothetical protein